MMTKQIIKQIWNERRSNGWIWAELLLVSVALWIIVDWGYVQLTTYVQPRGFNYENTYKLNFNQLSPNSNKYIPSEQRTSSDGEDFLAVVERLRHHPDIEYVSVSLTSSPYNGGNSWWMVRHDTLRLERLVRRVTPDFFNVFRYENADGSGSQSLADALKENTLVVTSNFMKTDPDGKNLIGKNFSMNDDTLTPYRVTAITNPVRYSDFNPQWGNRYLAMLIPEKVLAEMSGNSFTQFEVCVRIHPGTTSEFAANLLKDSPRLYNVGNCYIQNIQSFDHIRHSFQRDTINEVQKRAFVLLFLMVNIFLGVIGTFWYRTQQRRSELGLRIALGSSHRNLNGLLVSEGVYLLILAFIPSTIISYNVGMADLMGAWQMEWGFTRFLPGILITFVLMLSMVVAGIWLPARQAMKIQPAEALRDE